MYIILMHVQGLRIQDSREISPWDILEGVKNAGPLMLSWFGAVRMKRKPLKYVDQRRLVRFHTHQKRFGDMIGRRHYVSLPDPAPLPDPPPSDPPGQLETPTVPGGKLGGGTAPSQTPEVVQRAGVAAAPIPSDPMVPNPRPLPPMTSMQTMPMGQQRPQMVRSIQQQAQPGMWPRHDISMQVNQNNRMQLILRKIQKDQLEQQQRAHATMHRPSHYPNMIHPQHRQGQVAAAAAAAAGYGPAGLSLQQQQQRQQQRMIQMQHMQQMTPEQRQIYLQRVRMRQQQQQAAAQQQAQQQAAAGMMGGGPQYGAAQYHHPPGMVSSMQPGPPMHLQQPMQQGYSQPQMMVRQQFPPQQPGAPMNHMQRPMY